MNDVDWMMESDERKPNRVKMKDEADRCALRSDLFVTLITGCQNTDDQWMELKALFDPTHTANTVLPSAASGCLYRRACK